MRGRQLRDEWKPHYALRWRGRCCAISVIVVAVIARSTASSTDDKSLQFIYVPFRSKIFVRFLWLGGIPRQPELSTFRRFALLGLLLFLLLLLLLVAAHKSHDALMTLPVEGFNGTLRILLPHNNNEIRNMQSASETNGERERKR